VIYPALCSASDDRRLRHADRAVLLWLAARGILDFGQYKPLPVIVLVTGVRLRKQSAIDALKRLDRCGYVQCGASAADAPTEAQGARPRWYRLRFDVPPRHAAVPNGSLIGP